MPRTSTHATQRPRITLNEAALRGAMSATGITSVSALALRLKKSPATIHRVLSGRTVPGEEFIAALLAAFPNYRFEQLFTVQR